MNNVKRWPAVLYADDGDERVFNSSKDVPKEGGWGCYPVDHPRRGEDKKTPLSKGQKSTGVVKRWPAWCGGPNGEEAIYDSPEDLPNGWAPKRKPQKTAPESVAKEKVVDERTAGIADKDAEEVIMTKAEAMAALAENNIEFDAKTKKLELVKLILWAIDEGKIEAE